MKSLENKLIIYDSNCKVCSSLRDFVIKFTSIPGAKIKAYKDLNPHLNKQVDIKKFRNEMALIDTSGGETIYGAEGVAHIFSSQYKIFEFLFRFKVIFKLFDLLYKTQAYNRYIIAAPKSEYKCDCLPDRVVRYRLSYIVITVLFSILLTVLFGSSLQSYFPNLSGVEAATQMLLIAGTGWVLQIILVIIVMRRDGLDYIGNLGSIMVAGLLILVPSILSSVVPSLQTPIIPAISVVTSSAYMLYLHIKRVTFLGLSQAWTVSWFLLLQSTALFWIYFFHLKRFL